MNSCPYCNAVLTPEQLRPTGAKLLCPRCGEQLPPHLVKLAPAIPSAAATSIPSALAWTNRQIGLAILGVMAAMAVVGLTMALLTVESRRRNDVRGGFKEAPSLLQDAGALTGLGFLPEETNVVAAIQVAELLKDPTGKTLLATPRPPLLDMALAPIAKWAKLKPEDVNHVVAGTELKDKFPQVTLVVETNAPYDAAALAKALLPATPTLQRNKPLFRFDLQPGQGMLWCPRPSTLVFLFRLNAFKPHDLDAIPITPRVGTQAPPPAIRDLLAKNRVNKQSLAWVAGNLAELDALKEIFAVALSSEDVRLLTKLRGFGLSLYAQEGLVLDGNIRTADEPALRLVQKRLEAWKIPEVKSLKVEGPPPGTSIPAELWISLQMRGAAKAFRAVLSPGPLQ